MNRLLWAGMLLASSTQAQTFEAATVKVSKPHLNWIRAVKKDTPGRVVYENFPLKSLIRDAYGLKDYQVKGPAWIGSERYDIVATKPRGATPEQLRSMLRSLLQERFQLAVRQESRELAGYVLLPGKDTSKLRPAIGIEATPGCQSFGTMSDLADLLSRRLDSPVANQTGIDGVYYFILAWSDQVAPPVAGTGDAPPPPPPPAPPPCAGWSASGMPPLASSIFEAVKVQMGLKLASAPTKVLANLLLVERALKIPEAND